MQEVSRMGGVLWRWSSAFSVEYWWGDVLWRRRCTNTVRPVDAPRHTSILGVVGRAVCVCRAGKRGEGMPRFDMRELTQKDWEDIYDVSFEGQLFKRLDRIIVLLEKSKKR